MTRMSNAINIISTFLCRTEMGNFFLLSLDFQIKNEPTTLGTIGWCATKSKMIITFSQNFLENLQNNQNINKTFPFYHLQLFSIQEART